jgi:D-sedoheptulose 7-phosphate isomerase
MPLDFQEYMKISGQLILDTTAAIDESLIADAIKRIVSEIRAGGELLVAGNGGSAADAQHIVGELVGKFLKQRKAIGAICLSSNSSTITAWGNDVAFDDIFARQIEAHCSGGRGIVMFLSTSGNSPNVVRGAETARLMGIPVVSLTGVGGGKLAALSDVLLAVPSNSTPLSQQVHICLYHFICAQIEEALL